MEEPIRFRVTFELLTPNEPVAYEVSSLNGANKAIVLAAQKHLSSGKGHIIGVQVEPLPGAKPQGADLVDRMEW